jgi:hypothetical protein
VAAVVEAQPVVVAAGRGDGGQGCRVDARAGGGDGDGDRVQQVDSVSQSRRQNLFELGERTLSAGTEGADEFGLVRR